MKQNYECKYCSGREYHCFEYITESADGLIHVGDVCLIAKLRTELDLKRESKRLGLEDSQGKKDSNLSLGNSLETRSEIGEDAITRMPIKTDIHPDTHNKEGN